MFYGMSLVAYLFNWKFPRKESDDRPAAPTDLAPATPSSLAAAVAALQLELEVKLAAQERRLRLELGLPVHATPGPSAVLPTSLPGSPLTNPLFGLSARDIELAGGLRSPTSPGPGAGPGSARTLPAVTVPPRGLVRSSAPLGSQPLRSDATGLSPQ